MPCRRHKGRPQPALRLFGPWQVWNRYRLPCETVGAVGKEIDHSIGHPRMAVNTFKAVFSIFRMFFVVSTPT